MSSGPKPLDLATTVGRHLRPVDDPVDVSVILPCLNEEASVAGCVAEAREVLGELGLSHEVIVVDNGSEDASAKRAEWAGADVIFEIGLGYGNACRAGLDTARGRYLVMADADGTYDFAAIPRLLQLLDEGADVAMGNRLKGDMERGAMPWLHRHFGTPLINGAINALFGVGVGDVNCGLRAITRSAYRDLATSAPGMEFASEMVVRAAEQGLVFGETPVDYRLRSAGEPKLRTWSDGWRHMRLVITSWIRHVVGRGSARVATVTPMPTIESEYVRAGEFDADRSRL